MKTYFDALRKTLVQCRRPAGTAFWDRHWQAARAEGRIPNAHSGAMVLTRKHLAPGSRLLEGGCGLAGGVRALQAVGYDAYGVDYAPATVENIRREAPGLQVRLGDVRGLDFPDGFFDGYWSMGVIEHFYEGYQAIFSEMRRVLRPGGLLVLSFPHLSRLRGFKADRGGYAALPETFDPGREGFYQFLLDPSQVIRDLDAHGFDVIWAQPDSGLKGLKDESPAFLAPMLHALYRASSLPGRIAKTAIDFISRPWCGHTMLLAARKRISSAGAGL